MRTRSLNDLLIIVRDHIQNQKSINYGICNEIDILHFDRRVITRDEYNKLKKFMSKSRPMRGVHCNKAQQGWSHWWPCGEKEPRIAWLNSKIPV